jgi:hypothetical protein
MDIIPNRKSKLLYQKGDQKLKGVIDLRCFSSENGKQKYKQNKKNKIVSEIIKKEDVDTQTNTRVKPQIEISKQNLLKKSFAVFIVIIFLIPAIIFSLSFIQKSVEQRGKVLGVGTQAYDHLKSAGQLAADSDFENSIENFDLASLNFTDTKKMINEFGLGIAGILNNLPINTPVSTAENLAGAGESISLV